MTNNPDDYCTECGQTEKSKYIAAPNTTFICSVCVVNEQTRKRLKEEDDKKMLKARPKKRG